MLDFLVVSYPATLRLLQIFCESYCYHYKGSGKLHILIDKDAFDTIKTFTLPPRVEILAKEAVLPDHERYSGYLTQQYFKLTAHRWIEQDLYLVLDDDFVFLRPTLDQHFIVQGKPICFLTRWQKAGAAAAVFKATTEQWLKFELPHCFMTTPVHLLHRQVLKALEQTSNFEAILTLEHFSEYNAYGAYAFRYFKQVYHWIETTWGDEVLACLLNQPPPDYLTLDPSIQYSEFRHFNYVAFWSHWSLCEAKMREFFEASK
jgi:Family of unknown function (DUF6492)